MDNSIINISEQLLLAVKKQKETTGFQNQLKTLSLETLNVSLENDQQKKTFWINVYNAYYQILRKDFLLVKPEIYKNKAINIAGKQFSLDDIEHGILRKYRYKYSLGFLANIFTSKLIKKLAVDKLDYRIHFALNCGAKSCPPIAFYNVEKIDQQLNWATQSFLEGESEFDDQSKEVKTTALFKWFLADFGGIKGIKQIYKEQIDKDISDYSIRYKEYSWEDDLNNFVK